MKFEKDVNKALAACPIERQALADAEAKLEALHEERGRIQAAIDKVQAEPDGARTVTREIGGVAVLVPDGNRRDDLAALAKRRDQLPELYRNAFEQRNKAKWNLSRAVAAKLESIQTELQKRCLTLLEAATEICRDGDLLELAMQTAGLEAETVFAARFAAVQSLRTDQGGDGASIKARLEAA